MSEIIAMISNVISMLSALIGCKVIMLTDIQDNSMGLI